MDINTKRASLITIAAAAFITIAIVGAHYDKATNHKIEVIKLKPKCNGTKCEGRYASQNNDGDWAFYVFLYDSSTSNPYSSSSLPAGGVWNKGTESEIEEVNDTDATEESVDSTSDNSDNSADTDSSSSSDSSSSDSGGGDGGGE